MVSIQLATGEPGTIVPDAFSGDYRPRLAFFASSRLGVRLFLAAVIKETNPCHSAITSILLSMIRPVVNIHLA